MSPGRERAVHRSPKAQRRGAARLAAVQALYQMELTGAVADRVLREFAHYRLDSGQAEKAPFDGPEDERLAEADRELFDAVVRGGESQREQIDSLIAPALAPGWTLERMDRVLRATLRAGAFELLARPETPARVIISEYVEVANAFYEGKEPGFVNGVLDRIARSLHRLDGDTAERRRSQPGDGA
jgi:N utilization substance protein B